MNPDLAAAVEEARLAADTIARLATHLERVDAAPAPVPEPKVAVTYAEAGRRLSISARLIGPMVEAGELDLVVSSTHAKKLVSVASIERFADRASGATPLEGSPNEAEVNA